MALISCAFLGFFSMVSQVILLREVITTFSGNEVSLGLMLGSWLLWVGVGSFCVTLFFRKATKGLRRLKHATTRELLSIITLFIGLLFCGTSLCIRIFRIPLGLIQGEIVGLWTILFVVFVLLFPLCFLIGSLFVINSRVFWGEERRGVSNTYLYEALGATIGGILVTYVLIPNLRDIQIAFGMSFICAIVSFFLTERKKFLSLLIGTICIAGVALGEKIDFLIMNLKWKGFEVLRIENSPYGNLSVVKRFEQVGFFENGLLSFSIPDPLSAEEGIHFAILQHPEPRSMLLIGGGFGGGIMEALKYKNLQISYVELDPKAISLAEEVITANEGEALKNPRINIIAEDGRYFLRKENKLFDVIVVSLSEPSNAQINRFYTREFFLEVKRHLTKNGIFSFRVNSAENYISTELADFLSCLKKTMEKVFPDVTVLPGGTNIFLGANSNGILTREPLVLIERLGERGIITQFVNEFFLYDRLSYGKREILDKALKSGKGKENTDLVPICYYTNAILWSSYFKGGEKKIMVFFSKIPKFIYFIFILGIIFGTFFIGNKFSGKIGGVSLSSMLSLGFTGIVLELAGIIVFQVFFGYLYSKIGMILTFFMAGLSFGAWFFLKSKIKNPWILQGVLITLGLLFLLYISAISSTSIEGIESEIFFYIFMGLIGVVSGALFVSLNDMFLSERKYATGIPYGMDVIGSSIGAVLSSAVLIPVIGIPITLVMIIVMNLLCLVLQIGVK